MAGSQKGRADTPGGFDAVLVVSFGGPEGSDEVLPFLRNVTGGRVPDASLRSVAEHYWHFDGVSPINAQNRGLAAALQDSLAAAGLPVPVRFGNRHWHPFAREAIAALAEAGARDVAVVLTSGYASYPGCRWYQESLAADVAAVAARSSPPIRLHKIRLWFDHPTFLDLWADRVDAAVGVLSPAKRPPLLLATTHSLPVSMSDASGPAQPLPGSAAIESARRGAYVAQHEFVARTIAERVSERRGRALPWEVAFQSQAGGPGGEWLAPDVNDRLRELADAGTSQAVVAPIGFVSDHMEILWDLDIEARRTADSVGIELARAGTIGDDPRFVEMITSLVLERARGTAADDRPAQSPWGPWPDECPGDCCMSEVPATARGVEAAGTA